MSSFVAAALRCTPELCVPCGPPPPDSPPLFLTFWLPLSEHGAIYFYQTYNRLVSLFYLFTWLVFQLIN